MLKVLLRFFVPCFLSFVINSSIAEPTKNNHGISGLINLPNAYFADAGNASMTIFRGEPDRKYSFTFSPTNWMEGGFYYSDLTGQKYGDYKQSLKDKGFNVKFKLKEQGKFPALAIGLNDFAGTGKYSSEYIVSSYRYNNFDFTLGLGWGSLAGSATFTNPFSQISDNFRDRQTSFGEGGDFNFSSYFAGKDASLFAGMEYTINDKFKFKTEFDPTITPSPVGYEEKSSDLNFALDYQVTNTLLTSVSFERGNYVGVKFVVADNISRGNLNSYTYRKIDSDSKLAQLVVNLQENGISLEELSYTNDNELVVGLRQTNYQDPKSLTSVLYKLDQDIGLTNKNEITIKNYVNGMEVSTLKTNIKNSNSAFESVDKTKVARTIYFKEGEFPRYFQFIQPKLRTFIGSREGFLYYGLFLEHISKYMFSDGLFIDSQLAVSLNNNFDELSIPPVDTYPAQVRTDIKDYLNGIDEGLAIKRLNINKFSKLSKNSYLFISAGILEEMFNGFGFEYLNHSIDRNLSYGFEVFRVKKRGYEYDFRMLDYMKTTAHANLYYKFGNSGFHSKLSWGQYLAGDEGGTVKVWKRFRNGSEMGAYATFTDVSFEEYGEGSFDKGVFFKIPFDVFGQKSLNSYGWKPLTKDPGSKLNKPYELYNELIRFNL
ncbi:MAG: YjbH domain-containing protein [Gammaproteobacteria bacterium]